MTTPPSLVGCLEKLEDPNLLLTGKSFNFVVKLQANDYLTERQPMMSITWKTSALIHVAMECAITRNTLNLI